MKFQRALSILVVVFAATGFLSAAGPQAENGVVNINTADSEQLQLLPKVGPALAQRIIDFREANGVFRTAEEILAVKGIGERSLETLKPYLVTEGKTTLKEKVRVSRSKNGANSAG